MFLYLIEAIARIGTLLSEQIILQIRYNHFIAMKSVPVINMLDVLLALPPAAADLTIWNSVTGL